MSAFHFRNQQKNVHLASLADILIGIQLLSKQISVKCLAIKDLKLLEMLFQFS